MQRVGASVAPFLGVWIIMRLAWVLFGLVPRVQVTGKMKDEAMACSVIRSGTRCWVLSGLV